MAQGAKMLVLLAAVAAAPPLASEARAQAYDGCFINGQQVADSNCQGGGGGSSGAANPMAGAMGNMGFALGAALGTALRNALTAPPPAPAPSSGGGQDYWSQKAAVKAQQDQAWQRRQALDRAAAERGRNEFLAEQRALLGDLRDLRDAPNDNEPEPGVLRESDTPREYPRFTGFTADEKRAHDENFMGTVYGRAGNWSYALSAFRDALNDNPYGPFSDVIRDNIKIAERHLAVAGQGAQPAASAGSGANIVPAAAQSPPPLGKVQPAPAAAGQPQPATAQPAAAMQFPPAVPPNTYDGCNSVYQQWIAQRCQLADGNVNGKQCSAADAFLSSCVTHLGKNSWGAH